MSTYAILGTGMVGRAVAEKLVSLGHDVRMGTRDVDAAKTRTEPDARGREGFGPWLDRNADVQLMTLEEAVAHADVVVDATAGAASIEALRTAGETNLGSKIVVDIANPLDSSSGSLHLTVGITDRSARRSSEPSRTLAW